MVVQPNSVGQGQWDDGGGGDAAPVVVEASASSEAVKDDAEIDIDDL